MLNLLSYLPDGIEQVLEVGEDLNKPIWGEFRDEQFWISEDHQSFFSLHISKGPFSHGLNEADIYYGPGPACEDDETFPDASLCFFSHDGKCFEFAREYFTKLVQDHNFRQIGPGWPMGKDSSWDI